MEPKEVYRTATGEILIIDRFEQAILRKAFVLKLSKIHDQVNGCFHSPGIFSNLLGGHCYSGSKLRLKQAEDMMRGNHSDILWRIVEEKARKLIWC